jgi:putative ABC transport system substrate-binding protein
MPKAILRAMQAFAKELVELKPEWLIGHSTPVVTALVHATRTIPIVFASVSESDRQRIRRH